MKSTDMIKYDVNDPGQLLELFARLKMEFRNEQEDDDPELIECDDDFPSLGESDDKRPTPPIVNGDEEPVGSMNRTIRATIAPRMTSYASLASRNKEIQSYVYGDRERMLNTNFLFRQFEGIVKALLELHKLNLLHGSISPNNMFLHSGKDKPIPVLNDWDAGYGDQILGKPKSAVISEHIQDLKDQIKAASEKISENIMDVD